MLHMMMVMQYVLYRYTSKSQRVSGEWIGQKKMIEVMVKSHSEENQTKDFFFSS